MSKKTRLPQAKDILLIIATLRRCVPLDPDTRLVAGWRMSSKQTPNFRIHGVTNEVSWLVDIYAGQYHIVTVGSRFPEKCKTVPAIVNYLNRSLEVLP
jgi:hypothetical protein